MTLTKKDNPALLLIDVQKGINSPGYYGTERNNPQAEKNIEALLKKWRTEALPIYHVKHCSSNPESPLAKGKPGNDFQDFIIPQPNEPVIEKDVNSAFIGTDLRTQLENAGIQNVVIVGLTTEHCVSTSTRMASNYGFNVFLMEDGVAAFDKIGANGKRYDAQIVHDIEIANLKDEFATVVQTEDMMRVFD
ncbi:cysteine hydrolase [Aquimarina sp. BL5]|uniref:cysteine hydrolase family protein n=1 Tax=Aquimarina sp. BL5 TaxID=1714860 RepID=UPI000E4D959E|nr:cysteine hydrolase family protein [Aquimarina sp. BL5]AXT50581.1 cysteine hydrolase [Aquimarina sp. BL5]RKN02912.1 isochorismatase family protein [Aquimarina sp. BL5]